MEAPPTTPSTKEIRNIGLAAHIDAGKTTATERILFITGVTTRLGEVHEGTAFTDWMEQEQQRGISITAAATTTHWKGRRINIIDTPGHIDFTMEVERSMRVLDGVVLIYCGVGGVEAQAEQVWRQAEAHKVARIAFVNKMDRLGADHRRVMEETKRILGANPVLLNLPHYEGDRLAGVIDLIEERLIRWSDETLGLKMEIGPIPAQRQEEAQAARDAVIDNLTGFDEELLAEVVETGAASAEALKRSLREATRKHQALPVLVGSAFRNIGIQPLLDAVVDYLPSPEEAGRAITAKTTAALLFKQTVDTKLGKLSYLRVYAGQIEPGQLLENAETGEREAIEALYRMQANEALPLRQAGTGEIIAVTGIHGATTGQSLGTPGAAIALSPIAVPEPVVRMSIEPRRDEEREVLEQAVRTLADEDPSLRSGVDPATGNLVLSGQGELHLEVALERLAKDSGLDFRAGLPRVEKRYTIGHAAEANAQHGPPGAEAKVAIRLTPLGSRKIPVRWPEGIEAGQALRAAVEQGVHEALQLTANTVDANPRGIEIHPTGLESPTGEPALVKVAALKATRAALEAAKLVLLEPVAALEILTPEPMVGEVVKDLKGRNARNVGLDERQGNRLVKATVALQKLFGYATEIRSKTKGRVSFTVKHGGYQPEK